MERETQRTDGTDATCTSGADAGTEPPRGLLQARAWVQALCPCRTVSEPTRTSWRCIVVLPLFLYRGQNQHSCMENPHYWCEHKVGWLLKLFIHLSDILFTDKRYIHISTQNMTSY